MTTTDLKSGVVGELGAKSPVLVATMTNITLSGEQTVNGVAVVQDDTVLVNGQTDQTQNGVYVVSTSSWTRAVWFNNELNAVSGTLILTTSGTLWSNTLWEVVCADTPIVFGTSLITFTQFQKAGAGALIASNNLSDVISTSTARTNLGLAIGSNVQAYNTNLAGIAGLTSAANTVPYFTSTGGVSGLKTIGTASGNIPLVGTQSATTSLAGLAPLATTAQIQNGVDSNASITSAALRGAMANSIASSGYTYLPNGLIFQWGKISSVTANNTATANFPIPFPNNVFNTQTTPLATIEIGEPSYTYSLSTSQIVVRNSSTSTVDVQWFAIGN